MSINIAHGTGRNPRYEFTMADRMRKAQETSGKKVYEIADEIGVHSNTVSNWINGNTSRIKERDIKAFAAATDYPLTWLKFGVVPDDEDTAAGRQHSLHFRSSQATVRPSQPKEALVTPIRRRHHE